VGRRISRNYCHPERSEGSQGAFILIFKYFLREIIPQFFTALCVLSAVLVVSQLLRLSDALVMFGITFENVMLPFLFIILPFLSFTIPMAFLFAVLLTFSRMSVDGEFTALLAAGYSLRRAAMPVMLASILCYVAAALSGAFLEPWGRREMVDFYHRKAQTELDNMLKFRLQSGVFLDDFLGYVLYAEKIAPDRSRFDNVMLAPTGGKGDQPFTLMAPSGAVTGSVENGDLKMSFDYGVIFSTKYGTDQSTVVKFKRAEIDLLRIFQEQIFGSDEVVDDYRSYSPSALWAYVDQLRKEDRGNDPDYFKSRYLLHQRVAIPFATVIFALFAMVLGVQDPRKGKSMAYVGAIGTIIGGYVLMMGFKWLAENGKLPAPLAAWLPNVILLLFGCFLVYQKNRLPPSESTLDPEYIPGLQRLWRRLKH